jgi:hypothetical protein
MFLQLGKVTSRQESLSARILETGIPDIGHYRFEVVDKQTLTSSSRSSPAFCNALRNSRKAPSLQ